ncbi:aminoacyl-tRNA hydrolase [Candidatus Roizmanbacteria bacterium]|nr:aminoacyl-tRNA hydrolase [Candidatus Roizmanbacteria bacterium]
MLLVGLGNPGKKYEGNRHNAGFMFADYVVNQQVNSPPFKSGFDCEYCEIKNRQKLIVAKPQKYMNLSGPPVRKLSDFYKIPLSELIVAHDDLDIPLGKFKIQIGTGPKMHNGLDSLDQYLGSPNYTRIRIGVDNRPPERRLPGEAYVLQDFTPEEVQILLDLFPVIYSRMAL